MPTGDAGELCKWRGSPPVTTQTGRVGGAGRVCARSSSGSSVRLIISSTVCSLSGPQCLQEELGRSQTYLHYTERMEC